MYTLSVLIMQEFIQRSSSLVSRKETMFIKIFEKTVLVTRELNLATRCKCCKFILLLVLGEVQLHHGGRDRGDNGPR